MKMPSLTEIVRPLVITAVIATAGLTATCTFAATPLEQRSGMPTTRMILPALYSQSVFLKFVLGAYGKSDQEKIQAVRDAEVAIERFAFQHRSMHQVSTIAELDQMMSLFFPRFYTINDELDYRRKEIPPPFFALVSGSSEVEDALENLWRFQEARLEALGRLNSALNQPVSKTTVNSMIFTLLNNPRPVQAGLGLVDDRARLFIANAMHTEIRKGIAQIDSTGSLIAGSQAITHADPAMQRFFQLAIGEYFKGLGTQEKLNIIAEFINNPDLSQPNEKFEMMVMNSGPQFQKLFQVYAREEGFSSEMKDIFKRLESSVRPAPWRLVEPMIKGEAVPFKWIEIGRVPFGVGTMAQVHRATIQLPNGEERAVVVRVMKPGIESRLVADNQVLRRMAPIVDADPVLRSHNFPQITPFVNEIIEMGMKELNVGATVAAQKKGAVTYEHVATIEAGGVARKIMFHVPRVYDLGPNSSMIVQEFVPGRSFESFAQEFPTVAQKSVEELAKLWIEKALVGSGFYHADLHQGNIRVGVANDRSVQFNILDFGMSGQLDARMQSRIIALAAILATNRADLISKAMWELSIATENKISLVRFQNLIQKEITRISSSSSAVPNDFGMWVAMAANEGIKFPSDLSSLNRGITLMSQMLRNQGSRLQVSDIVKSAIVRNPMILRNAMKSMESISSREWMSVMWSSVTGLSSSRMSSGGATCKALFEGAR